MEYIIFNFLILKQSEKVNCSKSVVCMLKYVQHSFMFEFFFLNFMFILNIAGFSLAEYISNLIHVKISFSKTILTKQ